MRIRHIISGMALLVSAEGLVAATLDFDDEAIGPVDGSGRLKIWERASNFPWDNYSRAAEIREREPGSADHVLGATDRTWVSRVSGDGFDVPAVLAPDTVYEIQFDFRIENAYWHEGPRVGVGADLDGDGVISGAGNNDEEQISIEYQVGSFVAIAGTGMTLGGAATPIDDNDWIRVRMVIDFGANDGEGWMYIETMNLTKGETAFQRTLIEGTAISPRWKQDFMVGRRWNGVFMIVDELWEIDNVMVRVREHGESAQLVNLSTRVYVPFGREVTGGFVVAEGDSKQVFVRAVCQGLTQFGVQEFLRDPVMKLFRGGEEIATIRPNSTIGDGKRVPVAIAETGAFPVEGGGNIQTVLELPAGAYTFSVRSATDAQGEVLVEVYELPDN